MGTAAARSTIEGRRFLHKELWRVVERQLEYSKANPKGAFYDDLVAMVFALHALEAYLNYVGQLLAPEIWKDEREFFRREPYRGFDGKVRKVLELAGLREPDRAFRPYKTVWALKDLRDLMAHAKPEDFLLEVDHHVDDVPPLLTTKLDSVVTASAALEARDDVSAFAQSIHSAAASKISDIWFRDSAFGGVLQYSSSSTRFDGANSRGTS
jgi:hypothetical protein